MKTMIHLRLEATLLLLPLFLLVTPSATTSSTTSGSGSRSNNLAHGHYEQLHLDPASIVSRVGNVDVVVASSPLSQGHQTKEQTDDTSSSSSSSSSSSFAMCHLLSYLGWSRANGSCDHHQATKIYKELAAILLAIQHFNTGNGVVAGQAVRDIDQRCSVRLSAEFHDSHYSPSTVVKSITQILGQRSSTSTAASTTAPKTTTTSPTSQFTTAAETETATTTTTLDNRQPCLVVGARTSSSTGPSAIVSASYGLPQMSYTATSPELNDPFKYPLFSRVVTADDAAAKAAMRFLSTTVESTHVAVLYVNDPFGNEYNKALQLQAELYNIQLQSFPLAFPPDAPDIQQALVKVQRTGFRHVFLIVFSSFIEGILLQAAEMGLTGPDYFWLLGISTSFFDDYYQQVITSTTKTDMSNHPMTHPQESFQTSSSTTTLAARAFGGMAILPEYGAKPTSSAAYQRFVQAWNNLTDTDIAYFNSKVPRLIGGVEHCFAAQSGFFAETFRDQPGSTAHLAYDTVMAIGLGACRAAAAAAADGTDHSHHHPYFDGAQLSETIVHHTSFEGASGLVRIDPATKSRDPLRFSYSVMNVVPKISIVEEQSENGTITQTVTTTFATPEAFLLQPAASTSTTTSHPANNDSSSSATNAVDDDWVVVQTGEFLFADGTTTPPDSLPGYTVEMNYIGRPLRSLGLSLCALISTLSIACAVWTVRNRRVRVVKSSQPPFLLMICVGTFIIGSMIIPLSMDDELFEDNGRATDIACMSQPWLASIGFVTVFAALYSKTSRIHQIFTKSQRFSRVKVTEKDVLVPFVLLISANLVVLICWTVIARLQWVRTADPGTDGWNRVVSSTGRCVSSSISSSGSSSAEENRFHPNGDDDYDDVDGNDSSSSGGGPGALPYLILLAVINLGAVILANVKAYGARHIHTEFSESRYIGLINMFLLQSYLTGVPVVGLVYDNPQVNYVVISLIVFLTCMTVLLLIFVPKMIHTHQWLTAQQQQQKQKGHHHHAGRRAAIIISTEEKGGLVMAGDDDDDDGNGAAGSGLRAYRRDEHVDDEYPSTRIHFDPTTISCQPPRLGDGDEMTPYNHHQQQSGHIYGDGGCILSMSGVTATSSTTLEQGESNTRVTFVPEEGDDDDDEEKHTAP